MVQVLRLLRRLPVAEKLTDIAIFINRELLPFLQELRESTAATFEQVTTNTLLGRDTPGTGDIEEISLDDTLEFTGSKAIQRAAITGDVTIPAGSNVATVPALPGLQSAIDAVEADIVIIQGDIVDIQGDITDITTDVSALANAEYITYASNASLTAERVATTSDSVEVDLGTASQAKWNVVRPKVVAVNPKAGGTENAYVLPATLLHGDILFWTISGPVTINGIDSTGVVDGFEFTLLQANGGFPDGDQVTIVDESGSAGDASYRFGTPDNVSVVIGTGGAARIRYTNTRWTLIERGFPRSSTSIAYGGASGREIQRAALTGDVTASANSNTTAIAPGVIVNADVNNSAAIALTKTGAMTGFAEKASGSAATTSAEPIVTYSSSGNMSAERVTTASTSVTINTSVASQIAFERAALTGEVTAAANNNSTAITRSTAFLWTGAHSFGTTVTFAGTYTATVNGTRDDEAIGAVSVVRMNINNTTTLNGMVPVGDGQMVYLQNTSSSFTLTISHEAGTSAAANRFALPSTGGLVIRPNGGVFMRYDSTRARWLTAESFVDFSVSLSPTTHTGTRALDLVEGNGIDFSTSSSGGTVTITAAIDESATLAWTGSHTWSNTVVFDDDATFNGPAVFSDTKFRTGVFSTTLAGSTNDLAIGAVSVVRIGLTGSQTLTGMVPTSNGQEVWLFNADSADTLTLSHVSGSSSVGNQFICPNNVNFALPPRTGVALWKDTLSDFWLVLST